MSKDIKKKFSTLLICLALFILLPICAKADEPDEPEIAHFDLPCTVSSIKVGLYSGAEALNDASLQSSGEGHDIGYYDFSRQFRKICTVNCSSVTIKPDSMWHLLYADNYDSYSSASAAASTLGGYPAYVDGRFKVVSGSFDTESNAKARQGSNTEVFKSDICVIESKSEVPLFFFKSDRIELAVQPKGSTKLLDYIYSGGFEFVQSSGKLTVINYVDLENYVKGVLPYEVGGNWPSDSLKAQAVCARTYAINNINAYIDDGFDVRADTYSQVYRGLSGTTENTNIATDETSGMFVRYEGAICRVYYMSASGGATESGANVFGERREYLTGVTDPYEQSENYYNKTWSDTKSKAYLLQKLKRNGYELSDIEQLVPTYSETGNVIALIFTDSKGNTAKIRLTDCYMIPGLNSMRYTVTEKGDSYEFNGGGWGHNCGMSQWGAYSMAQNYGLNCDDIIEFYFSGAYIG